MNYNSSFAPKKNLNTLIKRTPINSGKDGYGGLFSKKTRPLQGFKRSCHVRRAANGKGPESISPKWQVTEETLRPPCSPASHGKVQPRFLFSKRDPHAHPKALCGNLGVRNLSNELSKSK